MCFHTDAKALQSKQIILQITTPCTSSYPLSSNSSTQFPFFRSIILLRVGSFSIPLLVDRVTDYQNFGECLKSKQTYIQLYKHVEDDECFHICGNSRVKKPLVTELFKWSCLDLFKCRRRQRFLNEFCNSTSITMIMT